MAWEGWTDDNFATAKRLWNKGYSGEQIRQRIGAPTRNTVIGKLNRAGVTGDRSRVQAAARNPVLRSIPRKPTLTRSVVPKTQPLPPPPPPAPGARLVQLEDLGRHDCRYPFGTAAPYTFCGLPAEEGSSYCKEHKRKTTRREKAA